MKGGGAIVGGVWVPERLLSLPANAHLVALLERQGQRAPAGQGPRWKRDVALATQREAFVVRATLKGLVLVSEANEREHHQERARRAAWQRELVTRALVEHGPPPSPWRVEVVRSGPRLLDSDNLAGSAKHIRDAVATWLGVDDGPEAPVVWTVAQAKGGYAVLVTITGGTR